MSRSGRCELEPLWPHATPRAAYVHIPFCRHHCGYCNFSVAAGRDALINRYLAALGREIGSLDGTFELDSLYVGGGTPSRLNAAQLLNLRVAIDSRFSIASDAEFSIEANPSDVTHEWLNSAREIGMNRLSLGAQSFSSRKLALLERDHSANDVSTAVSLALAMGLQVSIDLIFATPNESLSEWRSDLSQALDMGAQHLSTYELTFEKGTRFWGKRKSGELVEQNEDQRAELYLAAIELVVSRGLIHYEVSSFALPNSESRHNLTYWSGKPYFAFGSGASRFCSGVRSTNHASASRYMQLIEAGRSATVYESDLPSQDLARELLAIGLRQIQGIDEIDFQKITGMDFEQVAGPKLDEFQRLSLLVRNGRLLKLTPRGLMVYDAVAEQIATGG